MTINELLEQLELLVSDGYGDIAVVLSSDEEGNAFRHLQEVGLVQAMTGTYHVETLWDDEGEVPLTTIPDNYDDAAFLGIVLWP